jgi:hypothetical protein
MEVFDVKPAENAVAELLVRGMTPDECALHLGVSITTIRTISVRCTGKRIPEISPNCCSLSGPFTADLFHLLLHMNE